MNKIISFKIGDYIDGVGVIVSTNPVCVVREHMESYGKVVLNGGKQSDWTITEFNDKISDLVNSIILDLKESISNTLNTINTLKMTYTHTTVSSGVREILDIKIGDILEHDIVIGLRDDEILGRHVITCVSLYDVGDISCGITHRTYPPTTSSENLGNTSEQNILDIYSMHSRELHNTIHNLQSTLGVLESLIK